ncbi:MAG: glycosyltransferase [Bacteroidota bacterium]
MKIPSNFQFLTQDPFSVSIFALTIMQAATHYRIMICPLDWGLGHATRCIPLIRELQDAGACVVIAADGPQLKLLRTEFPEAEWIVFGGYRVRYGKKTDAACRILIDTPRLFYMILKEHFKLKSLIKEHRIDGVISDNRYGLWNRNIRTVFITHQLNIIAPPRLKFTEPFLRAATRFFAGRFDECWIPDSENEDNLSGKLSHGFSIPENTFFVGLLSRFDRQVKGNTNLKYDVIAIVSGPEPQRSIFAGKLSEKLPSANKKCLIILGIPGETTISNLRENLDTANHLTSDQLYDILMTKPVVISRAGYSTLMDIAFTGNKAILIATPGQTEQEYLASSLREKGRYYSSRQDDLRLDEAIRILEDSGSTTPLTPSVLYPAFISRFLESIPKPDGKNRRVAP